jgi:hypothetical protein
MTHYLGAVLAMTDLPVYKIGRTKALLAAADLAYDQGRQE